MKNLLNKLIEIKLKNRKNSIKGILLEFNDDWILLKNNPIDYQIDGYILINRKKINRITRNKKTKFIEKVLKANSINFTANKKLLNSNIFITLANIAKNYNVFSVEYKDDTVMHLGKLINHNKNHFTQIDINSKGHYEFKTEHSLKKLYCIEFNTCYINSLLNYTDNINK